jgi:RNA-dependent RNA polymerase
MILDIKRVPTQASRATVTKAIAGVLHSDDFMRYPDPEERLTNFQVHLNESPLGGVRNNGSGTLTLPSNKLGRDFMRFVIRNPIILDDQQLKFFPSDHKEHIGVTMTLEKTPYIDPDLEEERQQKLYELQEQLRVDEVQFGVYYRTYPKGQIKTVPPRAFSIECKLNYTTKSLGWLGFEYDHKLIRIEVRLNLFFHGTYTPFSHTIF